MTKEQLMAMGLTDEQATKVLEAVKTDLDGNYVTKARFNEVNTSLNQAKETVKERDQQLDTLKKSTSDVDGLKKQIETLQAENKQNDEKHQAEIKQLKFDTALTAALVAAKAKNPETVKPLLKAFLEKAEMDGESIKGLDGELKKLVESEDSKFLFDVVKDTKPGFRGVTPGESKKEAENPAPKTLAEAVRNHYQKMETQ